MNVKEIQEKKHRLAIIKKQLKTEFFGINSVIDQIVDTIQPWYYFNNAQTHPLIINLWGLTGTGKTSLVKRLVSLLEKEQAFFRFEMNDHKNKEVNWRLSQALEIYEGNDYLLCFDEFQHIRTIDENGRELKNNLNFNLWDLLDTGEFDKWTEYRDYNPFLIQYKKFKAWMDHGLKLSNGLIHLEDQPEDLKNYLKRYYRVEADESVELINQYRRHDLFLLFKDRFSSIIAFENFYWQAEIQELLDLMWEASKRKRKTEKGNIRKSLIFVVGNLDEAYQMSEDFDPDISADAFYKKSLEIKIPKIKEALKHRFRNEQIARLGNNHIIYPALNRSAYQNIILSHLEKLAHHFEKLYQIEISFDKSVVDLIYQNGVYPTQGVRPLLSTLKTYIDGNMGQILSDIAILELDVDRINIRYEANQLITNCHRSKESIKTLKLPVDAPLDKIREDVDKNLQTVTAVHEAGHATVSISLLDLIPSQINSSTAGNNNDGFTYSHIDHQLITKNDLINKTARFLAGLEAERLLFGEELISLGSHSDLESATELVLRALYENGMGSKTGCYSLKSYKDKFHLNNATKQLQHEAEHILEKARALAQLTLKQEETLFLKIAEYLGEHSNMYKETIEDLIKVHGRHVNLASIKTNQSKQPHIELFRKKLSFLSIEYSGLEERLVNNISRFISEEKTDF